MQSPGDVDWLRVDEEDACLSSYQQSKSKDQSHLPDWLRDYNASSEIEAQRKNSKKKMDSKGRRESSDRSSISRDPLERASILKSPLRPKDNQFSEESEGFMEDRQSVGDLAENDTCYDPIAMYFRLFHFISGLAATITFLCNIYDFLYSYEGIRDRIIHLYAALFGLIIVAVELEVPAIVQRLKLMDVWSCRGSFYIFVGCLTIQDGFEQPFHLGVFQNVAGIILCLVAMLYVLMVGRCF